MGAVDLVSRGVLDEAKASDFGAEAEREARNAVLGLSRADRSDDRMVADTVRLAVRRALARITGYKPEVEVTVVRVAEARRVV